MTSSPILLIVLSLLLCGLAAAQSDGCPEKEPEEWSPCGPDQANVSCNLGEAYGGDQYCWKACDGEWWTHFCAEAPPPDNGGKGEKGGDGDDLAPPQKPFQCSSVADCDSCLDHPSCDGWAGGFGCYSTCSYDFNDPQSLNVADVACYDSSNGGCEAESTNAADYQTCSEQTTCGGCTSTSKSGGGPCLWFADDFDDSGGGFCTNQPGMLCCPVDSCPAAAEDTVADNTGAVVEDESVLGDLTRDCQGYIAALVVCSSSSQEPACEGFDFEALLAGDLPVPANCEEADEVVCSALVGCCDKEIADIAACAAKSSLGLDCDIDCGGDGPDETSSGMKATTSGLLGLLIAIGGALVGRTV